MSFVEIAHAMAPQAGGGGDANLFASLMPFALIFVVFYFLLIRPQQKKAKEHKEMLAGLRKGDAVITAGGMYGRIVEILEGDIMVVDLGETTVKMGRPYLSPAPGSRKAAPPAPKKEKKAKKGAKEAPAEAAPAEDVAEAPVEAPAPQAQPEAVTAGEPVVSGDDDKDKPAVQ